MSMNKTQVTGIIIAYVIGIILLTMVSALAFGYFATMGFELYYELHPLPVEGIEDYTPTNHEIFM